MTNWHSISLWATTKKQNNANILWAVIHDNKLACRKSLPAFKCMRHKILFVYSSRFGTYLTTNETKKKERCVCLPWFLDVCFRVYFISSKQFVYSNVCSWNGKCSCEYVHVIVNEKSFNLWIFEGAYIRYKFDCMRWEKTIEHHLWSKKKRSIDFTKHKKKTPTKFHFHFQTQ